MGITITKINFIMSMKLFVAKRFSINPIMASHEMRLEQLLTETPNANLQSLLTRRLLMSAPISKHN